MGWQLQRAFRAFRSTQASAATKQCLHPNMRRSGEHCPDCGHLVAFEWTLAWCVGCHQPRALTADATGSPVVQERYCRACGQAAVRFEHRSRLHVQELPYAFSRRVVRAAGNSAVSSGPAPFLNALLQDGRLQGEQVPSGAGDLRLLSETPNHSTNPFQLAREQVFRPNASGASFSRGASSAAGSPLVVEGQALRKELLG
ncbi:MAG: hypothetical protein SFZ03_05555 [Candidatus Melainabacteria bacterium]|nr:hypothetical protein [Candidatus Melainabacteria bacterium]